MGHHKGNQHEADGVSGHGSPKAVGAGGPPWAEGGVIDRTIGVERKRQAWERLVASCRREAIRAVG
ncbi:MAG: hypothetical protein ACOYXR_01345 [Nitrospirota bacterium]